MILVDSSALIEYYRPSGSAETRSAVAKAIEADLVAINGVIQVEVVAFADVVSYRKLLSDFKVFHWLDLTEADFDLATEMGFSLRRKAITIPATDLIIAASAIRADSVLYHADSHYETVSKHCNLKSKRWAMQIVVKAAKGSDQDPIEIITRNVAETLGTGEDKAVISKVS